MVDLRSCPNLLRCCQNLDFGYSTHALADLAYNSHATTLQERIYPRLAKRHCSSTPESINKHYEKLSGDVIISTKNAYNPVKQACKRFIIIL